VINVGTKKRIGMALGGYDMANLMDLFSFGIDRDFEEFKPMPEGKVLNVGPGNKPIFKTIPIGLPEWNADFDYLPFEDGSIAGIHAYHFLEHCEYPLRVLQEFQRVLMPGGVVNILVPYYTSQLQAQDLDHKSKFSENTWRVAFQNKYYDRDEDGAGWEFIIGVNMIMGLIEKDICLVTQLIKRG